MSDCDLQYKLFYRLTFERDSGGVKTGAKTVSPVVPLTAPTTALDALSGGANRHADGAGEGSSLAWADAYPSVGTVPLAAQPLLCDKPEGVVPARFRSRVVCTFHPHIAGAFEFDLYAQVSGGGGGGQYGHTA